MLLMEGKRASAAHELHHGPIADAIHHQVQGMRTRLLKSSVAGLSVGHFSMRSLFENAVADMQTRGCQAFTMDIEFTKLGLKLHSKCN